MLDAAIIVVYLILVFVVGIASGLKVKNIKDFSVGTRDYSNFVLIAAIFASLVGAFSTLGFAEKSFSTGLIFMIAGMGVPIARFAVAFLIAPKMNRFFGLFSAGDILEKLYGKHAKIFAGIVTVIYNIFVIGAQITAIGFLFKSMTDISFTGGVFLGSGLAIVYSAFGGIKSVTFTDAIQFGVLIVAIPIIAGFGLVSVGGFKGLLSAIPSSHMEIPSDPQILWKYFGLFFLFATPSLTPALIQRLLMGRNIKQIKNSLISTGMLSIPFYASVCIIGLVALALYPEINANLALPHMVHHFLPTGLRGLMIAGLLAAIMSSLDSFLNNTAIVFSHDVVRSLIGNNLSKSRELLLARACSLSVGAFAVVSAIWFKSVFKSMAFALNIWPPFFFPPMFLGILGFSAGAQSYWLGFSAGVFGWCLSILIFPASSFMPATIAAFANFVTILIVWRYKRSSEKTTKIIQFRIQSVKSFFCDNLNSTESINHVFFAGFALSNSVLSFYLWSTKNCDTFCMHFPVYFFSSFLCFGALTRDYWKEKALKFFPLYWHFTLMVCLPLQTLFMVLRSHGYYLWLLDLVIAFVLLKTIVTTKTFVITASIGSLLGAATFLLLGNQDATFISANLAVWAIIVHISALFFFLLFFRKKDREIFYSSNAKMGHELSHFWNSLALDSRELNNIILNPKQTYKNSNRKGAYIPEKDLQTIRKLAKRLSNSSNYMKSNYEQYLLEIGLTKEGEKEYFSASKTVLTAFEQFAFRGNQDQRIHFAVSKDFQIIGRQKLLVTILINLMRNAFAAISSKKNGTITLSLDYPKRTIVVEDTGTGIAKTNVNFIFEEAFSTKKSGHGLGLFFCNSAMSEFGGAITCTSEENLFTRFDLSFPTLPKEKKHEQIAGILASN